MLINIVHGGTYDGARDDAPDGEECLTCATDGECSAHPPPTTDEWVWYAITAARRHSDLVRGASATSDPECWRGPDPAAYWLWYAELCVQRVIERCQAEPREVAVVVRALQARGATWTGALAAVTTGWHAVRAGASPRTVLSAVAWELEDDLGAQDSSWWAEVAQSLDDGGAWPAALLDRLQRPVAEVLQ